ncbi:MAG TPA: S41 family peptidase [Bryobacteraceae bacterium]|nr:S41 family peptidase [Bryobacteraceae bacterium]
MKRTPAVLLLLCASASCWGQLTPAQKLADFQSLASLYVKQYAPFQWKMQLFDYNLYKISPWVAQVQATTDDLGFYEIMSQYVAALNDAHSLYLNPSDFLADLRFGADIYDGKVLIDFIDRDALPASKYSFQIGDELVMVDNQTTSEIMANVSQFFSDANPVSTSRDAAGYATFRPQALIPRAEEVGATATVVIRRQAGNLETYVVPWVKSGTALTKIGPSPNPSIAKPRMAERTVTRPEVPAYRKPLTYLQRSRLPIKKAVLNFDALPPVFQLPAGFVQRLGNGTDDVFFSGTYKSGTKTIGYIRIADFQPADEAGAETAFDTEIAYMQKNTDGLVVDVMRNPGGDVCYTEDLVSRLMTKSFHDAVFEFRPELSDVQAYQDATAQAISDQEPTYVIQILQQQTRIVTKAYQGGGLTGQLPVCQLSQTRPPNRDASGRLAVYSKPILLLTDRFSASAAELFSAMFQDAKRGKNFGTRTMGAGGVVSDGNPAGYYSEGQTSVTFGLITRSGTSSVAGYPSTNLYENVGVQPDIENDYMTASNLLHGGADFVQAFTAEILTMIGK